MAFEAVALGGAVHLFGMRLLPFLVVALVVVGAHLTLAASTAKDRRLSLVFSRSLRYPRYARPWGTLATPERPAEASFPKRTLP